MVNKNLYVNSLNGILLYITTKMFGVINHEQAMSVGATILTNLDVNLPDSYGGIPL